jgi:antitoxin YefM
MKEISFTNSRKNTVSVLDRVAKDGEFVAIRKNVKRIVGPDSADELAGRMETAHLLRSPKNARRLLRALSRTRVAKDHRGNPSSGRR